MTALKVTALPRVLAVWIGHASRAFIDPQKLRQLSDLGFPATFVQKLALDRLGGRICCLRRSILTTQGVVSFSDYPPDSRVSTCICLAEVVNRPLKETSGNPDSSSRDKMLTRELHLVGQSTDADAI